MKLCNECGRRDCLHLQTKRIADPVFAAGELAERTLERTGAPSVAKQAYVIVQWNRSAAVVVRDADSPAQALDRASAWLGPERSGFVLRLEELTPVTPERPTEARSTESHWAKASQILAEPWGQQR